MEIRKMYLDVILLTFKNTNSIGILLKTIKEKLKIIIA